MGIPAGPVSTGSEMHGQPNSVQARQNANQSLTAAQAKQRDEAKARTEAEKERALWGDVIEKAKLKAPE